MPLLLLAVEDLVLWKDPKKSGGLVGAVVLLYILLGPLSPITLPQLLAAVVLVACPLLAAWHNAAPLLKRSAPGASNHAASHATWTAYPSHRLRRFQLCGKVHADAKPDLYCLWARL